MDAYLGSILPVGFNFAPYGWAMCQGQIMAISQNAALFSLLGINYGGNGTSNFGLPNLQGRMTLGYSPSGSPGLDPNDMGETAGSPTATLTISTMPRHTHPIQCASSFGDTAVAPNNFPSDVTDSNGNPQTGYIQSAPTATLNPLAVSLVGNGIPFNTMPPYLGINYIIALQGIFPARS